MSAEKTTVMNSPEEPTHLCSWRRRSHNKHRKRLQEVDNVPVWTQTEYINMAFVCPFPTKMLHY